MRNSTKESLKLLAESISEEYKIPQLLNSNEFLEVACLVADEIGLNLGRQTISRYEAQLRNMFLYKDLPKAAHVVEEPVKEKELKLTIHLYNDGSYEFIKPEVAKPSIRIPEYSMFVEGEDGLTIIKGKYVGRTIEEIDGVAGFGGAAAGWAKWCLKSDKDLTDDDRNVFHKIIAGQI